MDNERLLTPEEAAERLAISPSTLKHWLRTNKFPGVKLGKLWRVRESDLNAYIKSMTEN